LQKNVVILFSDKNIEPTYHGKRDKIQLIQITDFVFAANGLLKVVTIKENTNGSASLCG
jgi:hypothetical protein